MSASLQPQHLNNTSWYYEYPTYLLLVHECRDRDGKYIQTHTIKLHWRSGPGGEMSSAAMTEREEIEVLRWYLHEITVAWDCERDDEVAHLLNLVDAHRWCDENGFLACDESLRRVFAGAID